MTTDKRNLFSSAIALAALFVGACTHSGGDLLFLSSADGDLDIYVSQAGETRQLTVNDHDDLHARWSPDGKRIVYTSMRDGNPDIVVMRADGSDRRQLTTSRGLDAYPDWSPDGRNIAFVSTRTRSERIHVIGTDGQGLRTLTPDVAAANLPVWSPDGVSIAFIEGRADGGSSLAVIAADGTAHRRLIDDSAGAISGIDWSPDGSRILYAARRDKNNDIYVIDVASGTETRLTTNPWIDADPVWSPDGSRIAWLSARDDTTRRQTWIMKADGSAKRNVSGSGAEEMQAQWSPDGRQVAFVGYRGRQFVAWILDIDSGERVMLAERHVTGSQFQPYFNPRRASVPLTKRGTAPARQYGATQSGGIARPHSGGS